MDRNEKKKTLSKRKYFLFGASDLTRLHDSLCES